MNDMNPGQSLFTMPSASDIAASTSPGASGIVTDFLPMIYFIIALVVFFALLAVFLQR